MHACARAHTHLDTLDTSRRVGGGAAQHPQPPSGAAARSHRPAGAAEEGGGDGGGDGLGLSRPGRPEDDHRRRRLLSDPADWNRSKRQTMQPLLGIGRFLSAGGGRGVSRDPPLKGRDCLRSTGGGCLETRRRQRRVSRHAAGEEPPATRDWAASAETGDAAAAETGDAAQGRRANVGHASRRRDAAGPADALSSCSRRSPRRRDGRDIAALSESFRVLESARRRWAGTGLD